MPFGWTISTSVDQLMTRTMGFRSPHQSSSRRVFGGFLLPARPIQQRRAESWVHSSTSIQHRPVQIQLTPTDMSASRGAMRSICLAGSAVPKGSRPALPARGVTRVQSFGPAGPLSLTRDLHGTSARASHENPLVRLRVKLQRLSAPSVPIMASAELKQAGYPAPTGEPAADAS